MAENNAKNYEGGTKGLGSVKTDVVSPALQKLTELSVKLRALTDNILEIKAKKVREEEERRAEEERRKEAEELLRIQKEEAEKKKAEEEAAAKAKEEEIPGVRKRYDRRGYPACGGACRDTAGYSGGYTLRGRIPSRVR